VAPQTVAAVPFVKTIEEPVPATLEAPVIALLTIPRYQESRYCAWLTKRSWNEYWSGVRFREKVALERTVLPLSWGGGIITLSATSTDISLNGEGIRKEAVVAYNRGTIPAFFLEWVAGVPIEIQTGRLPSTRRRVVW
jgi:hypothetical protein